MVERLVSFESNFYLNNSIFELTISHIYLDFFDIIIALNCFRDSNSIELFFIIE